MSSFVISENEFLLVIGYLINNNISIDLYVKIIKYTISSVKDYCSQLLDLWNRKNKDDELVLYNTIICMNIENKIINGRIVFF